MSRTKNNTNRWPAPLAARLRPQTLADFAGQLDVLGPGSALREAIRKGTVGSLILWGPPGVGKTTLAHIIAHQMDAALEQVSAVTAGIKDLRDIINRAKEWQKNNRRTVLIVDEIHRFNKAQQDVLLPVVEDGLITLIGATTENPYFEVIKALISRAEIVQLFYLTDDDLRIIIKRALKDQDNGLAAAKTLDQQTIQILIKLAGGDARRALNILERAALATKKMQITANDITSAAQKNVVQYDRAGDTHYDTISAFIKSLRGSDIDAALFYLFRMIVAGEDPKFIIRRLFIFASEDIGNADPHALMLVSAAAHALEWIGLPEAEYSLAHTAIYLAAAPKSNSVTLALMLAKNDVARHGHAAPPRHVTNAPIKALEKHGQGVGYKNPHNFHRHIVAQQYRPSVVQNNTYYQPGTAGFEKEVKRRVELAREILKQ